MIILQDETTLDCPVGECEDEGKEDASCPQPQCQVQGQLLRVQITGILYLTVIKCLHSTSKRNIKAGAIRDLCKKIKASFHDPSYSCCMCSSIAWTVFHLAFSAMRTKD